MRHIICFLMALLIMCTTLASVAEEANAFSYRNGIQFGDSRDAIREKELGRGSNVADTGELLYKDIVLSGIKHSSIYYRFDEEGCLSGIKLRYDNTNPNLQDCDYHGSKYDIIENGLQEKYGDEVDSELLMAPGGVVFDLREHYYGVTFIKSSQRIVNYDEKQEIVIQHVLAKAPDGDFYWHYLSYQLLDKNAENVDIVLKDL